MKTTLMVLALVAGATVWIMDLQRRLQAAQMRGDMYRDISARLDKRVAELTSSEHAA